MRLALTSRRVRLYALALLLPALVLRALVPAGVMPAVGPDAGLALQMCSAGSAVAVARADRDALLRLFDPATPAPLEHDERGKPCDFALSAHGSAPPPVAGELVLATLGRAARPTAFHVSAPARPLADHARQPRAPPALS